MAPKQCSKCGKSKQRHEFNRQGRVCKVCKRAASKQWYLENRDRKRARKLHRLYGLTVKQFDRLHAAQGGACAICRRAFIQTPQVDHDHTDGHVRGLLCNGCNSGLARFEDDSTRIRRAITYLRKSRSPLTGTGKSV